MEAEVWPQGPLGEQVGHLTGLEGPSLTAAVHAVAAETPVVVVAADLVAPTTRDCESESRPKTAQIILAAYSKGHDQHTQW